MQFTCLGTRYLLAMIDASVLLQPIHGSAVDLLCTVTCFDVTIDAAADVGRSRQTYHWTLFPLHV